MSFLHKKPARNPISRTGYAAWVLGGLFVLFVLGLLSTVTGSAQMSLGSILTGQANAHDLEILFVSRIPRTIAVILSGSAMAVAGMLMQMLVQNRYVEPSTTGVTEAAGLGVLLVTIYAPGAPQLLKMSFAVLFALAGALLLIVLIRSIPYRDVIIVPLLGLVLSGVIGAIATIIAWSFQLQDTLLAWLTGDFSGVIRGRYELLWIVAAAAVVVYLFANAFTVIGLGENLSKNLGLNHQQVTFAGLSLVAIVAGVTTIVSGMLPFLGLVVPNLVSLIVGDYMRKSLPLIAVGGAIFVLAGDLVGRTLIAPAEIPVGVVMGVVGALIFLSFLLKTSRSS